VKKGQYIEDIEILFRTRVVSLIICSTEDRCYSSNPHPQFHPQPYTRNVVSVTANQSSRKIIIKTKSRPGQQQYFAIENEKLCKKFVTSMDQIEQCKWTVLHYRL